MLSRHLALVLPIAALLLALHPSTAQADPSVDYLDPLIAELEARSEALEGSEDKDEQKQKKTIDKLLEGFAKESKGPDKDLKAAAKAAKKLAKVFPEEFPAPGMLAVAIAEDSLADLILQALELFSGDVDAILASAQELIDSAPTGCADKAQSALDKVEMILEEVGEPDPSDLASYAKTLAKALKKGLKIELKALAAQDCTPKTGKLPFDKSRVTIHDVTSVIDVNSGDAAGTHFGSSAFLFFFTPEGFGLSFNVSATEGTHFVTAQYTTPTSGGFLSTSVTITKYPNSLPGHVEGTFDVGNGTAVGSFQIATFDNS